MSNKVRQYPLVDGSTIQETYDFYRTNNPLMDPKDCWEVAEHFHRNYESYVAKQNATIAHYETLIPYQMGDKFDKDEPVQHPTDTVPALV